MAIQALEEAWIVEGYDEADRSIKVSDNPKLEEERGSGKLWLRRVEVRAVLDEAEWNSPSEEPYGFVGTRRAWIVRNEIRGQPRPGPTKKHYPALISSRGKEELCGWIERVRNANARPLFPLLKTLSDKDLDLLRPLLLQLARQDIVRILARNGGLTSESVRFLERIGRLAQVQEPGSACGEARDRGRLGEGMAVRDPAETFWQRFGRHIAFADAAARAGGSHFGARSGQPGAIGQKAIADMTPLTKAPGAQFEISIDGKPRSYRDRKAVAIEPAEATHEAWAAKLRARNIGDFRHWKDHEKYMKSLERVLRDLSVSVP